MYSTAFWCLIVVYWFFWLNYVTTVTPFISFRNTLERSELRSVGVLDQSQQKCRFFAEIQIHCKLFTSSPRGKPLLPLLEISSKKDQIEPFVPDFEARLAFVQCLWPLLRLLTNLHYDKHLHDGCQGGNDTSTRLLHCEKASPCTRRVSANCHNAN